MDLIELEGAILRRQLARVGFALVLLALGGFVASVGLGFLIWSLYLYLALALGPPGAALVTGAAITASAGVLLWLARKITR